MLEAGWTSSDVVGVDSSAIIDSYTFPAGVQFLSHDMGAVNSLKAKLRNNTAGGWDEGDCVITEDVLTGLTDAHIASFAPQASSFLDVGVSEDRVVHFVRTHTQTPTLVNVMSLADWKAVYPAHSWVDISVVPFEVL